MVAIATGTRVSGVVIALGYLLGWVDGPVVIVVGGIALVTYGRSLLLDRTGAAVAAVALAVIAGGVGIGALRWGTLTLSDLRGAQAVLGPTVAVGPAQAAIAAGLAGAGCFLALAVWLSLTPGEGRTVLIWGAVEALIVSLCLATVFVVPTALLGMSWAAPVASGAAIGVLALIVGAISLVSGRALSRLEDRSSWIVIGTAAAAVTGGAAAIASVL